MQILDWLPVDTAAKAIVELSEAESDVVLVSHPKPVKWNEIMKVIADDLKVNMIPYNEWFDLLNRNHVIATAPEGDNPGLRLLDVFQGLRNDSASSGTRPSQSNGILASTGSELAKAMDLSETLRNKELPQLVAKDAELWLQYWRSIKFL